MAKKRKPGGGRKPNPNKKVMFSTRLEPHVMAALRAAAKDWPQGNLSTFAEFLIDRALREREEARCDPDLQALLLCIRQLAENVSGMFHVSDKGDRDRVRRYWRTNFFYFRAFKVAVGALLNAMEEPKPLYNYEQFQKIVAQAAKEFDVSPELTKLFIDVHKSPEAYGAYLFAEFQARATRADPLNDEERELVRDHPDYIGNYFDRLPRAWGALQLRKTPEQKKKILIGGDNGKHS